ncbi:MAG TPA: alpha/beta hydrolase, partial [Solirubrobacteraceae bacterium]|nr:alpha/beta hydrolase [Solirubrobacteraceae bacterium]
LEGTCSLVAPDLRGRGRSNGLPPPFGVQAYVRDLLAVLDAHGVGRGLVVGHSLGAYIVARLAADHPERVTGAVLVDGGLTIPGIEGVDPQVFIDAFLGPALARLKLRFETREDYRAWWRAHPALATADDVSDEDLNAYADHDLEGDRSSVAEEAVRTDASELLEIGKAAHRLTVPATLVSAARGLVNDPNPMQPPELVEAWVAESPDNRRAVQVPGTNHYTLTLGSRGAVVVADEIRARL